MPYRAPVAEFRFLLDHVVGFAALAATDRFAEATPDTVEADPDRGRAALRRGARAAATRAATLHPARLENGVVRTSPGFAEGYGAIAEGGWMAIVGRPEHRRHGPAADADHGA